MSCVTFMFITYIQYIYSFIHLEINHGNVFIFRKFSFSCRDVMPSSMTLRRLSMGFPLEAFTRRKFGTRLNTTGPQIDKELEIHTHAHPFTTTPLKFPRTVIIPAPAREARPSGCQEEAVIDILIKY
jgi:hypothetical protein